ncbi:hypothetical protein AGMMS50268_12200 [Spirochaetia bacterium]|nr:hypothetical protein AGMMS50268_12200 [Spirochaetia bacterium]
MAKFDQSSQLPMVFQKNNLSILPVTRGEYLIGPFKTHLKVDYSIDDQPQPVIVPELQTLDYTNLYSEAAALLFAYNSGIIKDIMNSEEIHFTVFGRMSSGHFQYSIKDSIDPKKKHLIKVQNAQIEIDAGYESPEAFCICEAKNIAAEDMLIRQLYYPYRLWEQKISKPIIPILFIFSNDIFHVFKYTFEDPMYCNSIQLIKHLAYTFADEDILLDDITNISNNIKKTSEPDITFPQADFFPRVVDLLSVLFEKGLTPDEVTLKYGFDPRQTSYYISACEYLGLVTRTDNENGEREYHLTLDTQQIMAKRYKAKNLALVQKILERPVFKRVFELTMKAGTIPEKQTICRIMAKANLSINSTTIKRRSSTVRGWIEWILKLTNP